MGGCGSALAGCGEGCGLLMPAYRSGAICACWAGQSISKLSQYSLPFQDNVWVGVSGNWYLTRGGMEYNLEVSVSLNFLSVRVPVLIRNEHGPLVRVIVDMGDTADVGLRAVTFSLEGSDDVGDIEALSVYGTDQKDELPDSRLGLTFPQEQRFGETLPPAVMITFRGERALSAGKNVFWLSCRVKDSAKLSHHVSAVCTQIETTQGVEKPKTTSPDVPHRIGISLRKHQDDGVDTYRIAALGTSPKGTLLCVYDMRRRMDRDLQEDIDIGLSRREIPQTGDVRSRVRCWR